MAWTRDPVRESIPNPARRLSRRGVCALARSVAGVAFVMLAVSTVRAAGDWPMWGGSPDRNLVSDATGLPTEFASTRKKTQNIRWSAELGSQTYGNPIVADGRVYIGTNNGNPRDASIEGDRGVLMCFRESDGAFLWQAVHDKLETGDKEDWAEIGICSTPCVVGNRVYYVSNRCELVAVDAEGFRDGENDGPFTGETAKGEENADILWKLDMRGALGVRPYQASASSPVAADGLVFVVTGHGVDEETREVENPEAPSFVAADAKTGKVVWQSAAPGERLLEGQWGSPAYGVVDGTPQVAMPGGDGVIYAFAPKSGELLWKFDCKAHEPKTDDGRPATGNQLLSTPVYHGHRLLVAVGQNPEAGGGPGCLRAIDARKKGDVTKTAELWRIEGREFGGSIGTVAVHDGLVYATELDGFLSCVELESGKRVWRHDLLAYVWGSPFVADGKVFVRNEDGDVVILKAGRELEEIATNTLPGLVNGTVIAAGSTLYIAGDDRLFAVAEGAAKAADSAKAAEGGE